MGSKKNAGSLVELQSGSSRRDGHLWQLQDNDQMAKGLFGSQDGYLLSFKDTAQLSPQTSLTPG